MEYSSLSFRCVLYAVVYILLLSEIRCECELKVMDQNVQKNYLRYLKSESTQILNVNLLFDAQNKPNSSTWRTYDPSKWEIALSISGRSILTSHPDIGFYSLGLLTLNTDRLQIPITSEPDTCLNDMSEDNFTISVFNLLSSGLKSSIDINETELSDDVLVCREHAIRRGKTVYFMEVCCHGTSACDNVRPDVWQLILNYSIMIIGFIVFLYIENFIPAYFYKDRLGYRNFYHELGISSEFKVTDNTTDTSIADAELETEDFERPSTLCSSCLSQLQDLTKGNVYRVRGLWLKTPDILLVSRSYLPIDVFLFLYRRLVRCYCYTYRGYSTPSLKISQLHTTDTNDFNVRICCELPICNSGRIFSKFRLPSWSSLLQIIMAFTASMVFTIPWILIYFFDHDLPEGRRAHYAYKEGLVYLEPLYAFNWLRFVKIASSGLSLGIIFLYGICLLLVLVIITYDVKDRDYIGKQIRSILREAGNRWDKGRFTSSRMYSFLFLPFNFFRNNGLLALLLWPCWLITACPLTLMVVIVGNTPTVYCFVKLLFTLMKDISNIFRKKKMYTSKRKSFQRCVVFVSLIYVLCIVHLLVFSLVSLVVHIIAFTLAGVIVTADETFHYTSLALLIILNARECFQSVKHRYVIFHQKAGSGNSPTNK